MALDPSEYTVSREHGWITVYAAPTVSVEVSYNYSRSLDMVISNWDPNIGNYLYYNQIYEASIPDLECDGELSWVDVSPSSTVTGIFTVENVGDDGSELNWEVSEYPEWGTWTFIPDSGSDLTPEAGSVIVNVSVTAPPDENTEFTGKVKMVNTDNPSDYCEIDIYLKTPRIKSLYRPMLSRIIDRFPNVFLILRYIFR